MYWEFIYYVVATVLMLVALAIMVFVVFRKKDDSMTTNTKLHHADVVEDDPRLTAARGPSRIEDDPAVVLSECVPPFCNIEGKRP